ncbi:hypothetical protein B0T25DRAFT_545443 [Lasiosphaeria hispida]|uniref:MYND-type domain-containing protein n=1 Tax=Lasiosphaeria hispida TaxID=260671 RepID=A0AAJ0MET5_9PEZI|nr:hypothetical protein B0T25DRAFT_545443 [Lasiosphaeria hispida]
MVSSGGRVTCSCGRNFGNDVAMQQHQRDSPLHSGADRGSAEITSNQSLGKKQYANFRDKTFFPDFADLPNEDDIDLDFYYSTDGFRYTPQKSWCFMAEIVSIENFVRLRLIVKSGRTNVPIAFYTDDRGAEFASQARVGYTVAVMYANQHPFLDLTTGIRVEAPITVQIIPMKLAELLALSDRVQKYSSQGSEMTCHSCDERKPSMQRCGRCSMFWYCDKNCQTAGWHSKGHKNECKIIKSCGLRAMFSLDWNKFDGFLGFPLPGPE